MIELRSVSHAYGDRPVLNDLSLTLSERRIGVVGANGSGKSTFARLLNGLIRPTSGSVLVDGLDTARDARAVRRKVGFVFQNPDNQIVYPIVAEDLAFGLKALRLPKDELAARIDATLARFHLDGHRDHPAHSLSGGQKQMLALAGVLIMAPAIIVMDEPTTLLDLRNRLQIARTLASLDEQLIVVSHDLDLLADFDRILVFDQGRIVCDAAPAEALAFYRALMA